MKQPTINPDCPCTYSPCSRHGNCEECLKYHQKTNSSTTCGKR